MQKKNWLQLIRISYAVILSYWDANFKSHCGKNDFLLTSLLLLAVDATAARLCCST